MNPPNLVASLEKAIKAEPDGWRKDLLHVSDTRHALRGEGCPRQLWLRVHGARENDERLGTSLMFDHGKRIHERVCGLLECGLKRSGWKVEATERSVVPELMKSGLGIERGRLDIELVHRKGARAIVDLKTVRGRAFRYLKEPKRPHVVQLQTYMRLRGAPSGVLLYLDREGQNAARQFYVERDDDTVERAASVCRAIVSRKEPPPPLTLEKRGKLPWQCSYCPFKGVSCDGPQADLNAGLASMRQNGRRQR